MGVLREAMQREMALRGFAPKTQRVYLGWIVRLSRQSRLSPDEISEAQVRDYLAGLAKRGLSPSTVNQAISAVIFFFRSVVPREWKFEVRHQRAPQRLPVVMSAEEVARFLAAVPTLRERVAMEIAYGAGLRLNEVLRLKVTDIDSQRMILRVDQGKGRRTGTSC
jgi:integrase/recombinase XerD